MSTRGRALTYALLAAPDTVKTVQTLDTTAFKQLAEDRLNTTDELIPGTEREPEKESFSIQYTP